VLEVIQRECGYHAALPHGLLFVLAPVRLGAIFDDRNAGFPSDFKERVQVRG
jgi:hypothetical protein